MKCQMATGMKPKKGGISEMPDGCGDETQETGFASILSCDIPSEPKVKERPRLEVDRGVNGPEGRGMVMRKRWGAVETRV